MCGWKLFTNVLDSMFNLFTLICTYLKNIKIIKLDNINVYHCIPLNCKNVKFKYSRMLTLVVKYETKFILKKAKNSP